MVNPMCFVVKRKYFGLVCLLWKS